MGSNTGLNTPPPESIGSSHPHRLSKVNRTTSYTEHHQQNDFPGSSDISRNAKLTLLPNRREDGSSRRSKNSSSTTRKISSWTKLFSSNSSSRAEHKEEDGRNKKQAKVAEKKQGVMEFVGTFDEGVEDVESAEECVGSWESFKKSAQAKHGIDCDNPMVPGPSHRVVLAKNEGIEDEEQGQNKVPQVQSFVKTTSVDFYTDMPQNLPMPTRVTPQEMRSGSSNKLWVLFTSNNERDILQTSL
jgi:hypothetical protein